MMVLWKFGIGIISGILFGLLIFIISLALPVKQLRTNKARLISFRYNNLIKYVHSITRSEIKQNGFGILISTCVCYIFLFLVLQSNVISSLSIIEISIVSTFIGLITLIDIFYHKIVIQLNIIFLVVNIYIGIGVHGITSTIIGGLVGFVLFSLIYLIGKILKSKIKKKCNYDIIAEPLSFADLILGSSLSILVGWPLLPIFFIISFSLAGFLSLIKIGNDLLKSSYKPFQPYAFAPFINFGALITLLSPDIIRLFT